MPRLMAVSLTEPQVRAWTKTVTRRAGWRILRLLGPAGEVMADGQGVGVLGPWTRS